MIFLNYTLLINVTFTIINRERNWKHKYAWSEWQWYLSGDRNTKKLGEIYSKVPMLPLVPLPSLAITKADINFTMEVKQSTSETASTDTEASVEASATGGFWGMKYSVKVAGKVATHKENTRSTDNSAKYEVNVHAEQLPATEGMLKLSDYLTQMLEPSLIPLSEDTN